LPGRFKKMNFVIRGVIAKVLSSRVLFLVIITAARRKDIVVTTLPKSCGGETELFEHSCWFMYYGVMNDAPILPVPTDFSDLEEVLSPK